MTQQVLLACPVQYAGLLQRGDLAVFLHLISVITYN